MLSCDPLDVDDVSVEGEFDEEDEDSFETDEDLEDDSDVIEDDDGVEVETIDSEEFEVTMVMYPILLPWILCTGLQWWLIR